MEKNEVIPGKTLLNTAFLVIALSFAGVLSAEEHAWISVVPKAVPQDQVYRVNIQRIDGKQPMDARQHRVDTGEHTLRVSLLMETQFAPKLSRITDREIYSKEMTFTTEQGVTYFIGAKVDPDASDEAQRDGSFWDPIIYKKKNEK
jgi:hypothetical protein